MCVDAYLHSTDYIREYLSVYYSFVFLAVVIVLAFYCDDRSSNHADI